MRTTKPPGATWKIRILVEHEALACRSTDFAPMVKVNGTWRLLEEHEEEWYWEEQNIPV